MYIYLKVKSLLKINLKTAPTQMIQILKVSSVRKRSLKIIGPRCWKNEKDCQIEDYYEQGSMYLR